MSTIENRLLAMGLALPSPPAPGGNYSPFRKSGNLVYLAGVICVSDGNITHTGQVGSGQTIETGYEAARVCCLNALAALKLALGDLDLVTQFVFMSGYVSAVPEFDSSPLVINGASDLLVELYGEAGRSARAAVAVAGLPKNATVEIQVTAEFEIN